MMHVPSVDFKLSLVCFSAISTYGILKALSRRVTISRIQILEDGQQVLIYDSVGNAEKVAIREIKIDNYNEGKNLLELSYNNQTKQLLLLVNENITYEPEILHAICSEGTQFVDFKPDD